MKAVIVVLAIDAVFFVGITLAGLSLDPLSPVHYISGGLAAFNFAAMTFSLMVNKDKA